MQATDWIIIDTETDGCRWPIHVVEICAQRMRGWEPWGEPFRVWLNHDVPIPREVVAIHGYDRAFLRRHGIDPHEAHRALCAYTGGLPFVAHNLAFDWDRVLVPEWTRLGLLDMAAFDFQLAAEVPPLTAANAFGRRGFCSVALARRVLGKEEVPGHGLQKLRAHFGLNATGASHQALGDVQTTVELICHVLAPRLRGVGLDDFDAIAAFTRRTPVASCVGMFLRNVERAVVEAAL